MTEWYLAGMLWRLENGDELARRRADERAGRLAYALRRAVGRRGHGGAGRHAERRSRTAHITG